MSRGWRWLVAVALLLCIALVGWQCRPRGEAGADAPSPSAARIGVLMARQALESSGLDRRPADCEARVARSIEAQKQRWLQRGDAHGQASIAALTAVFSQTQDAQAEQRMTQESLQRQRRAAPSNPDVAWFAASTCVPEACDPGDTLQQLVTLEPDNAANWLKLAVHAMLPRDDVLFVEAMRGAAAATRHDARAALPALAMLEVLTAEPLQPQCRTLDAETRMVIEMGMLSTRDPVDIALFALYSRQDIGNVSTPGYVADRCTRLQERYPALPDACRKALELMAGSDVLSEREGALSALLKLGGDEPALARWEEQQRQIRWMRQNGTATLDHGLPILTIMRDGEIPALQARLQREGRWPPPADWQR